MVEIGLSREINYVRYWSLQALKAALPDLELEDDEVHTCAVKIRATEYDQWKSRTVRLTGSCLAERFDITATFRVCSDACARLVHIDVLVRGDHRIFEPQGVYPNRIELLAA